MRRSKFIKTIGIASLIPIMSIAKSDKFRFNGLLECEMFGNEKFKSEFFDEHLNEFYGLNPDEFKIDYSSSRVVDFDCYVDYERSGKISDMIFLLQFDCKFTQSGYKKYQKQRPIK